MHPEEIKIQEQTRERKKIHCSTTSNIIVKNPSIQLKPEVKEDLSESEPVSDLAKFELV